jgi:hypothetical protein
MIAEQMISCWLNLQKKGFANTIQLHQQITVYFPRRHGLRGHVVCCAYFVLVPRVFLDEMHEKDTEAVNPVLSVA